MSINTIDKVYIFSDTRGGLFEAVETFLNNFGPGAREHLFDIESSELEAAVHRAVLKACRTDRLSTHLFEVVPQFAAANPQFGIVHYTATVTDDEHCYVLGCDPQWERMEGGNAIEWRIAQVKQAA